MDIIKSKAYSGVKVTDIGAKIFEEPSETPEGYDSDPEIYNNSKILAVNQSKMLSVKKEKKSQK